MAGVRIELSGAKDVLAFLAAGLRATEDQRGMMDAIGASLVASTQKRFEDETDPSGKTWPASLRATLEGGRTLTDSGRLVSSMTHEATSNSVRVGTNVIYAAIHQFGGTIKAKTPITSFTEGGLRFRGPGNGGWVRKNEVTIPQRAFLGIDEEDEAAIRAVVADHLGLFDDEAGGQ